MLHANTGTTGVGGGRGGKATGHCCPGARWTPRSGLPQGVVESWRHFGCVPSRTVWRGGGVAAAARRGVAVGLATRHSVRRYIDLHMPRIVVPPGGGRRGRVSCLFVQQTQTRVLRRQCMSNPTGTFSAVRLRFFRVARFADGCGVCKHSYRATDGENVAGTVFAGARSDIPCM